MRKNISFIDRSLMEKTVPTLTRPVILGALLVLSLALGTHAAESPKTATASDLDKLVGQPADLAPWAYAWRADRQVQEKPEACFAVRRLELL
jgi:hypothetical protein